MSKTVRKFKCEKPFGQFVKSTVYSVEFEGEHAIDRDWRRRLQASKLDESFSEVVTKKSKTKKSKKSED